MTTTEYEKWLHRHGAQRHDVEIARDLPCHTLLPVSDVEERLHRTVLAEAANRAGKPKPRLALVRE